MPTATAAPRPLPRWILTVSGIFAIIEIAVSFMLCFSTESVVESVDLNARGVLYLVYMWAARQLALGVIFAYATFRRSASMLTIAYLFLLVMFIGDLVIGIIQKENTLIISALVMCVVATALLLALRDKN